MLFTVYMNSYPLIICSSEHYRRSNMNPLSPGDAKEGQHCLSYGWAQKPTANDMDFISSIILMQTIGDKKNIWNIPWYI